MTEYWTSFTNFHLITLSAYKIFTSLIPCQFVHNYYWRISTILYLTVFGRYLAQGRNERRIITYSRLMVQISKMLVVLKALDFISIQEDRCHQHQINRQQSTRPFKCSTLTVYKQTMILLFLSFPEKERKKRSQW